MKIRRKIDAILSQSTGQQLLWLFVICIVLLVVLFVLTNLFFDGLVWQDIIALFLDPGCFGGKGEHDIFRLIVSLIGCFAFSALLISVFSNIINNISDNWHSGRVRYSHNNHIIILGSGNHCIMMLKEMSTFPNTDIVIMTSSDVENFRKLLDCTQLPKDVRNRIVLYNGERNNMENLISIQPMLADKIYILGENDEADHDNINLQACKLLSEICVSSKQDIYVTVVMENFSSMEVISRYNDVSDSHLKIDYINIREYQAEGLIVDSDFMPIIKENDNDYAHFIIFGNGEIARIMALTIAHNAHYPNFTKCRKRSKIDLISDNIEPMMREFVTAYHYLFNLSNWSFYSNGNVEHHSPSVDYGDYLDIEWGFYNSSAYSDSVKEYFSELSKNDDAITRIVICEENDELSLNLTLHLSSLLKNYPVAVYQRNSSDILEMAVKTNLYGNITVFGSGNDVVSDSLFLHRIERGMKVNYFYDKMYNPNHSSSELNAWYSIPEAHKFSSIYSGNASVLRNKVSDNDTSEDVLCEIEHRRWCVSCLILGYQALTLKESEEARRDKTKFKALKKAYIHPDITPFELLSDEEKQKDKLIISAMK